MKLILKIFYAIIVAAVWCTDQLYAFLSLFRKKRNTTTISCSLNDPAGSVDVRHYAGPVTDFDLT